MNPESTAATIPATAQTAFYRAVWRWHFYAGIIVAPFAIFLAITGTIYLWKPQYEAWRYRALFTVPESATAATADAQVAAARATHPKDQPITFTPAFAPGSTSETVFRLSDGENVSVYTDPADARVVGELRAADRFMRKIHDLHGTLLAGNKGEYVVELIASWAIVLFLTGLYLWWPRPQFTVWGFFLPRLRAKGRVFWRDVHAVPAVWLSIGTLFLLSTGLLWTKAAGSWYRTLSATIGQGTPRESSAGAQRSELTGWSPPLQTGLARKIDQLASTPPDDPHAEHHHHGAGPAETAGAEPANLPPSIPLAQVIATTEAHHVAHPYAIAFPIGATGVFSAITDRNFAFQRTYLHLDRYSGRVLAEVRYDNFGYLAKFSLWSIIAHEGQLFGLLNQILSTLLALGVILLAGSGLILWWSRRPSGKLGVPAKRAETVLPRTVIIGVGVLSLVLPLMAATLAVLLIVDRLLWRQRPAHAV